MPPFDAFSRETITSPTVDLSTTGSQFDAGSARSSFQEAAAAVVKAGTRTASLEHLRLAIRDERCNRTDLRVLLHIMDRLNGDTGTAWPGRDAIAKAEGLSVKTVRNTLYRLRTLGYITWEQRGRLLYYTVPHARPSGHAQLEGHTQADGHARDSGQIADDHARPAGHDHARPSVHSNLVVEEPVSREEVPVSRRGSAHARAHAPEVEPDPDVRVVEAEAVEIEPPPRRPGSSSRQRSKKARAAHEHPDLLGDAPPRAKRKGKAAAEPLVELPEDSVLPDEWRAGAIDAGISPADVDEWWGTMIRWANGANPTSKIHSRTWRGWRNTWGNWWRRELRSGRHTSPTNGRTSSAQSGGWVGAAMSLMGNRAHG